MGKIIEHIKYYTNNMWTFQLKKFNRYELLTSNGAIGGIEPRGEENSSSSWSVLWALGVSLAWSMLGAVAISSSGRSYGVLETSRNWKLQRDKN